MLKKIAPRAHKIILPELRTGRAEAPNNIKKIIDEIGCETIIVRNVSGAIKEAFSIASKDDLICATGSQIGRASCRERV